MSPGTALRLTTIGVDDGLGNVVQETTTGERPEDYEKTTDLLCWTSIDRCGSSGHASRTNV